MCCNMTNVEVISWPKDFIELKRLDNLLRCGICYDYMKTPMITSCSHNYCSLCIRKYMQYKSVCPTCLEETFEVNLRINRTLDEIITVFSGIRDKIIRHLKLAAIHLPKSNDGDSTLISTPCASSSSNKNDVNSAKSLKHNLGNSTVKGNNVVRRLDKDVVKDDSECGISLLTSPITPKASETSSGSPSVTPVTKIPSMFYSPKKSAPSVSPASSAAVPTVSCPVCSVDIPERNINIHLDNCLARVNSPTKCKSKVSKRDPIPKRVYSMMSEKDLRKWLKNYGLNTLGDKKALINRLQRYTVLYNSECDSDNPRPVSEIIRLVEKEEKDEKMATSGLGVMKNKINRNADQKVIDIENKKYIEKNKSHFESLINAMRERDQKYIRPTRPNNRVESDSEDGDSYYYRETERISVEPSTSKDCKINGTSEGHYSSHVNGYEVDSDDVIEIRSESPDLSNGVNYEGGLLKRRQNKSNNYTVPCHVEAEVYINEDVKLSPKKDENHLKTHSSSVLCDAKPGSPASNSLCKSEVTKEEEEEAYDSEGSDESISLLADYKSIVEEKKPSPNNSSESQPLSKQLLESQIVDPDFMVTESELVSSNMTEDSEDIFVPTRRSKRHRSDKVECDLPKRVLRRKRTN